MFFELLCVICIYIILSIPDKKNTKTSKFTVGSHTKSKETLRKRKTVKKGTKPQSRKRKSNYSPRHLGEDSVIKQCPQYTCLPYFRFFPTGVTPEDLQNLYPDKKSLRRSTRDPLLTDHFWYSKTLTRPELFIGKEYLFTQSLTSSELFEWYRLGLPKLSFPITKAELRNKTQHSTYIRRLAASVIRNNPVFAGVLTEHQPGSSRS